MYWIEIKLHRHFAGEVTLLSMVVTLNACFMVENGYFSINLKEKYKMGHIAKI